MEFIYRPAEEKDIKTIKILCESRFGEGYITEETLCKWLDYGKLFLVAECEKGLCGYSFMMPDTDENIAKYMNLSVSEVSEFSNGKKSVHYKSAALFPEYEGMGLMRKMTEIGINDVREMGCGQILGPAWKYGDFIPMHKLLVSFGFVPLCEKENIWYGQTDYVCIYCHGRCRCKCVVYRKIL